MSFDKSKHGKVPFESARSKWRKAQKEEKKERKEEEKRKEDREEEKRKEEKKTPSVSDVLHWKDFGHALIKETSFYIGGKCVSRQKYCRLCEKAYECEEDDDSERFFRGARECDLSLCRACDFSERYQYYSEMSALFHDIDNLVPPDGRLATSHLRRCTPYRDYRDNNDQ